jgi:hypothetical protein
MNSIITKYIVAARRLSYLYNGSIPVEAKANPDHDISYAALATEATRYTNSYPK